ncbi:MAG: S41 family peptidase [Planctomycetota bacterium]|nr:S41 family peptidase [Planctomycetota bacterium]
MAQPVSRLFWSAIFGLVVLVWMPVPDIRAQEAPEAPVADRLERRVVRSFKRLAGDKVDLWNEVLRLESLGPDAVPYIRREMRGARESARLAGAKALCRLGQPEEGITIFLELAENGKDLEVRGYAADLLGIEGDQSIEQDILNLLRSTFDPTIKIRLAKSLWKAAHNVEGSRVLKKMLDSEDVRLQHEAALALAEIDNIEAARPILVRLQKEPTSRGRLAGSYLAREAMIKKYEEILFSGVARPKKDKKGDQASPDDKEAILDEVSRMIREHHDLGDRKSVDDLVVAATKGMASSLDPHSSYWTPTEWREFLERLGGEYAGIGVYVGMRGTWFTVISPIYSGPAYEAGIRTGDRIIKVEGWSTFGKGMTEIVKRVKGKPGTSVQLTVARDGWVKPRDIEVVRRRIQVQSVHSRLLPGGIGYVEMTQFGEKASDELKAAIQALEKEGMTALVFDLRGNGGGLLREAIEVSDLFLPAGKLVAYSQGRSKTYGIREDYKTKTPETHGEFPVVILLDEGTASASEIVAGALHHHGRAFLVGRRSFGKGTVQHLFPLKSRPKARLRMTIARYFLPDGTCVNRTYDDAGREKDRGGVQPDFEVQEEESSPWNAEYLQRLIEQKAFQKYLKSNYETHQDQFRQLAENDGKDPGRYPGFDEWYESVQTHATRNTVRQWLRSRVRQRVADEVGQKPLADYLEDTVLQKAISELLKRSQVDPESIPEYKTLKEPQPSGR